MNKCRISTQFLSRVKKHLKGSPENRRVRDWVAKWKPEARQGKVFYKGKQVVPLEATEAMLKTAAESKGMPLSRDGAFEWLKERYWGFKQRRVNAWLKSVEQLQLIRRKPHSKTRINSQNREGVRNWRLAPKLDGPWTLGVDLFDIPKEWSAYKFFMVSVLQKTGFVWLHPLKGKFAKYTTTKLRQVFADCKKRFGGEPGAVYVDDGNEFKGDFKKFVESKGAYRKPIKLVSWVEKKNSTFARTFAVMRSMYGFKKALELTLEKVNGTQNRVTRRAPAAWTPEDFLKKTKRHNKKMKINPKRLKPVTYEPGTRVRHALRATLGKTAFYKSYEGMRSRKHAMWSKRVFTIEQRRKVSGRWKYRVNDQWWFGNELIDVPTSLVKLSPAATPAPKPSGNRKKPRKERAPKPEVASNPAPVLRRSTRIRKKPVRYGF